MLAEKKKYDWSQVALQTCILANCWIGKGKGLQVSDFPYCEDHERRVAVIDTPEKLKTLGKWFFGAD